MKYTIYTAQRLAHRRPIGHVALHERHALLRQTRRLVRISHQTCDLIAARDQLRY
jgi:hypothetical protein